MKKLSFFLAFLVLSFLSASSVIAQNKAGINIGDHWNEFDQAAGFVGRGGWIVVMACPGDGDKIAANIAKHPEINLIIRGHYPGNTPNAALAKSWSATLGAIPTPNKIYFMPWNEPNQYGFADWADPSQLVSYIETLKAEFEATNIRGNKVILLSPMLNHTWVGGGGDFDDYVGKIRAINSNFFSQFDGISMNLYDIADGCGGQVFCSKDPHFNPKLSPDLLGMMGASGKPVFGVESGTAGNNFYWRTDPDSNSPLFSFVQGFLESTSARMFAIPSYDLAGERGHTWSLYTPDAVAKLLANSRKDGTTPASSVAFSTTLSKCPGKNYTFYEKNEGECAECGGGFSLLACKPIPADNFGEEYSKETIQISEKVQNTFNNACNVREFTAKATVTNVSIPFAYDLNKYFLGPYMDNLGARVGKQNLNPLTDYGVFEKMAPKGYQDELRLKFLEEIVARGPNSKYANFRINGMGAAQIAERFRNSPDKSFLTVVWPQVPLFANEESEGEIVFEGPGISGSVKTSVPEVYRLNRVTTELMRMTGFSTETTLGERAPEGKVLAACTTEENFKNISLKETKPGFGNTVCTSEEIQPAGAKNNINAKRTYDQSIFSARDFGECNGKGLGECCGQGGKCAGAAPCVNNSCQCQGDYPECNIRKSEHTFDVDISIKNKVPFLKEIVENTVGEHGFFRIFVPYLKTQGVSEQSIGNTFRDVAGEAKANINLGNVQERTPIEVDVKTSSNLITLLFYQMGTMINVKELVSGIILWPWQRSGVSAYSPTNAGNLAELFEQVGNTVGVPPKILEAVMQVESPETFKLTAEEVKNYSQSGKILPGCKPNECSAAGPMQLTTGTDSYGSTSCNRCACYSEGRCVQCPNQWANHQCTGNPCNLVDNVTCAAKMLKSDSGASSSNWTADQVNRAISAYGGCDDKYVRLGNRTYCEFVWDYYQGH